MQNLILFEQEIESIVPVRKSVPQDHYLSSLGKTGDDKPKLVMTNSDPQDRFFYIPDQNFFY